MPRWARRDAIVLRREEAARRDFLEERDGKWSQYGIAVYHLARKSVTDYCCQKFELLGVRHYAIVGDAAVRAREVPKWVQISPRECAITYCSPYAEPLSATPI